MTTTLRAALLAAGAATLLGGSPAWAQSGAAAAGAAANSAAADAKPEHAAPLFNAPPAAAAPAITQAQAQAAPSPAPPPAPAVTTAATADTPAIDAAGAEKAEAAVHAWIASLIGTNFPIPPRPVHVTPAGDHYDVVIRFVDRPAAQGGPIDLTAVARPQPGGAWLFSDVKHTSPLVFTLDMPKPAKDGTGTIGSTPVLYHISSNGQNNEILFDPTFATPTVATQSVASVDSTAKGPDIDQTTHIGPITGRTTITPRAADRVDLTSESRLTDYTLQSTTAELGTFHLALHGASATLDAKDVSRSQFHDLVRSSLDLLVAVGKYQGAEKAKGAPPQTPPTAQANAVLAALSGLATSMQLNETGEGMSVEAMGITVTSGKLSLNMGGNSTNGILGGSMLFGLDGVAVSGVALGDMAALVPTAFSVQPFVNGIPVQAGRHMMELASENKDPSAADIQAMFAQGGVTAGVQSVSLSVGGADFTGDGQVLMRNASSAEGTGVIRADNFDALVEKVSAIPAFGQAIPAMIFVKGIGKMEDGKLVWHITYNGNKLLVNGVDLSAMAGGTPKPSTPAPAPNHNPPTGGARKR